MRVCPPNSPNPTVTNRGLSSSTVEHHPPATNAVNASLISGHNAVSSHVNRDGHVDCLQQCHPTIHSACFGQEKLLSASQDVVPWLNSGKPLATKP